MRKIESGALAGLPGILGVGGGGGQDADVFFDDKNLQQILDATPHIRRRRSNLTTTGVFITGVSSTGDAGAAVTRTIELNPYTAEPGVAGAWPSGGIPETHDVWFLGARGTSSAAGNLTGAILLLTPPATQGFNPQLAVTGTGGAAVAGQLGVALRTYNAEQNLGALGVELVNSGGQQGSQLEGPIRVPRGCTLTWFTRTTAAGATVFTVRLLLGLFPAGYGQDVVHSAR